MACKIVMTVNFPNQSRSFDDVHDRIRFWGYDQAMEISFFIEAGALRKIDPKTIADEDAFLSVFDNARDHIETIARNVYRRNPKGSYSCVLLASDF